MAWDLAIDYNTGDLKVAPNEDFQARTGPATIDQRIRVRLRIEQGEWALDPSGGQLGSRLSEVLRLPNWRAMTELELVVKEALASMDDIDVQNVIVTKTDERTIGMQIEYIPLFDDDDVALEQADVVTSSFVIPTE
jgi:hypothetical protein